jgi:hypothetical protein
MTPETLSRIYFSRYFYSTFKLNAFALSAKQAPNLTKFYYFSDSYHANSRVRDHLKSDVSGSFYQNSIKASYSRHFFFPYFYFIEDKPFDYAFQIYTSIPKFKEKFFTLFLRFLVSSKYPPLNSLQFISIFFRTHNT